MSCKIQIRNKRRQAFVRLKTVWVGLLGLAAILEASCDNPSLQRMQDQLVLPHRPHQDRRQYHAERNDLQTFGRPQLDGPFNQHWAGPNRAPQASHQMQEAESSHQSAQWTAEPNQQERPMRPPHQQGPQAGDRQAFAVYRASLDNQAAPTAPTLARQLLAPPPFGYEFALAPMNTIQLHSEEPDRSRIAVGQARFGGARSLVGETVDQAEQGRHGLDSSARSTGSDNSRDGSEAQNSQSQVAPTRDEPERVSEQASETPVSDSPVDKTIEPRQRRRIFNRILKKAEWNHLFVEVSKVFLRHFLDLALKDIIGKQSGASAVSLSSGSSGSESTSSRKKLEAQSELAELFKDFVKTAISNI